MTGLLFAWIQVAPEPDHWRVTQMTEVVAVTTDRATVSHCRALAFSSLLGLRGLT